MKKCKFLTGFGSYKLGSYVTDQIVELDDKFADWLNENEIAVIIEEPKKKKAPVKKEEDKEKQPKPKSPKKRVKKVEVDG